MLLSPHRRLVSSRLATLIRLCVLIFLVWAFVEAYSLHSNITSIYSKQISTDPPPNTERIFIASLPWNNEIILRTHWINQLKDLIRILGVANVYVSIYENGSYDDTKGALRDLYNQLNEMNVKATIVLEELSHADIIADPPKTDNDHDGWIKSPRTGELRRRRIDYLAQLRNTVLKPLWDLEAEGEHFEKVLFLNDIVYSPPDILRLLNTRDGKYAAACALDFETAPAFYDTFALRDSSGYPAIMQNWPFFRSRSSREALMANKPIPVQSCWNGAIAFDATPFYSSYTPKSHRRLEFRGVADSLAQKHVEGSECCLIHADNPLSSVRTMRGVWINPNVRVGYCAAIMNKLHEARTWEDFSAMCTEAYEQVNPGGSGYWLSMGQLARGLWSNRVRRWLSISGDFIGGRVRRHLQKWESEAMGTQDERHEPGDFCLVDEMQVLAEDGWRHL
ncbi:glycosyltransferase family 69 protein [Polychaeton citri CBS 116435]|uniref:Glycosyltransferase family 69 protein n=1 Tax=Polychaeton citri CBS 116435 TaxID=1314669 RepID=A0A9P4UT71_9PEZI|nr:glycosyltransferase family 69 protein [Polychaeton citri CBS 116435]